MTGYYYYSYPESRLPLILKRYGMPVKVLDEKGERYLIEYQQAHANGHQPGTRHWVLKKNVTLNPTPKTPPDINLPYKD